MDQFDTLEKRYCLLIRLTPGRNAGSPWVLPPRAPTDPDVPDSGIRLVKVWIGSYAYTEWTTWLGGSG